MRDNSPARRQRERLERKTAWRTEAPRVLIVCEGEKTEKLYFEEIRQVLRIPTMGLRVTHSDLGTSPIQVVTFGELQVGLDSWDEVWCVFDRDEHQTYGEALQKAKSLDGVKRNKVRKVVRFQAVPSNPCFELWYLLHFADHTREEHRDQVYRLLKGHFPEYSKSRGGMWSLLDQKRPEAILRADALRRRASTTGNPNPSTDVDLLVLRLLELQR